MTFQQVFGLGCGVFLIAFIVFAFRQGIKVKPSGKAHPGEGLGYGAGAGHGSGDSSSGPGDGHTSS